MFHLLHQNASRALMVHASSAAFILGRHPAQPLFLFLVLPHTLIEQFLSMSTSLTPSALRNGTKLNDAILFT